MHPKPTNQYMYPIQEPLHNIKCSGSGYIWNGLPTKHPNTISTETAALHATNNKRQRDAQAEALAAIEQERNLSVLCVLRLLRFRLQGSLGVLMDSQGAHRGP